MRSTLDYYNKIAKDFIADTVDVEFNEIHQMFLKHIPVGGKILDLGCGSGRDSKAFMSQGYQVVAVDGSVEMCKAASELTGLSVLHMMFHELDYVEEFHGAWACASLLHVPFVELPSVLEKVKWAMKAKGCLYMSFKYGDFEGERNGRYFTDMDDERLVQVLEEVGGLTVVEKRITMDVRPGREDEKWLNVVVAKG